MLILPYRLEELKFAFCNRIFFRTHTYRRRPVPSLSRLSFDELKIVLEPYNLHLLELTSSPLEVQAMLSLQPSESTSSAISKTKGRISKWLSHSNDEPLEDFSRKALGRGYFALTIGSSHADAIEAYLDKQSEHHGYANRARPPVWVQRISQTHSDQSRLATDHACTSLRYHLVFATTFRQGVFTDEASRLLTQFWVDNPGKYCIEKVSFLPDHVHIAVAVHPIIAPSQIALTMMNGAQEFIWNRFPNLVIQAKINRLWQPSAYIGSFGELTSPAISSYMSKWSATDDAL